MEASEVDLGLFYVTVLVENNCIKFVRCLINWWYRKFFIDEDI